MAVRYRYSSAMVGVVLKAYLQIIRSSHKFIMKFTGFMIKQHGATSTTNSLPIIII